MLQIVAYRDRHRRLRKIFDRSAVFDQGFLRDVDAIVYDVRENGDEALLRLTERYDGVRPEGLRVPEEALSDALAELDEDLLSVLRQAADNIRHFHEKQMRRSWFTDDGDGVILGQRVVPLERVGLYVPGGAAFYPSSLLMNAIPAQVAGCDELVITSPPAAGSAGYPASLVLAAAAFLGIQEVYSVGGAQAIAAMAYGTDSIRRVDKIVGPGNAWVAAAKKQVFGQVDIDAVAGPSEIVVLADEKADPVFVAADLLAQAEHDEKASAVLATPSQSLAAAVCDRIEHWWPDLDRKDILARSLEDYSACIITDTLDEAVDLVNELAPEHLEIIAEKPWELMTRIRHAGAIFLGPYASEPVGDYFAGPNHVLPTSGTARYASALGVDDFLKHQSVISYTGARLLKTGPAIVQFAEAEQLTAHAHAITVRLDALAAKNKHERTSQE